MRFLNGTFYFLIKIQLKKNDLKIKKLQRYSRKYKYFIKKLVIKYIRMQDTAGSDMSVLV